LILSLLVGNIAMAQQSVLTGKVTDSSSGESLPGVSIVVKGTTYGTVTDMDGNFTLQTSQGATLVFSFVGYKTQEIVSQGQQNLTVSLVEDTEQLDEVVVVGYGVQKKREITGSIAKIDSKDIGDRLSTSFESVLAGQAPGVSVTTGSGMAGAGSVVRVRGVASINSAGDPLYVVDGIPITNDIFGLGGRTGGMNINPLSSINTNDIESIEILKDASATGIYGSRGANGVVLITTKKAKGISIAIADAGAILDDFVTMHKRAPRYEPRTFALRRLVAARLMPQRNILHCGESTRPFQRPPVPRRYRIAESTVIAVYSAAASGSVGSQSVPRRYSFAVGK
jgi:TonB-dependent SusC/RagA subfamily outer membrane receptor